MIRFFLIALFFCIPKMALATNYCNDASIDACYLMNEGSGTTLIDHSINVVNGTFSSAGHPAWSTTVPSRSYIKYSLNFVSTDSVSITGLLVLKPAQSQSEVFWLNTSIDNYAGGNPRVICRANLNDVSGMKATAAYVFFVTGGVQLTVTSSNNTVSLNNWHHIGVTWDGSNTALNVHIYIDGAETTYQGQVDGSTLADNSAQTLFIGNRTDGTRSIAGYITEMALFKRILTSTEISDIYNNGLGAYTHQDILTSGSILTNGSILN